ncbi:MAG: MarR family winged helix-turn-helix transcriptional regulator, partial [Acetobacteraceae bacterium]|nr:MarR family winged helix-turn-helix transcriptional regulator [Acetobacteraceae bacterium]
MPPPHTADPLADRIAEVARSCYALEARRTANGVARLYNAALATQGLEVAQFSTLCAIAMGRADSVTALARGLGVDRSTLVRNLERLQRDGLIRAEAEGRRVRHALTPAGVAALT